ncbi:MAG: TolC family protein [Cytophagaceae bacterium]|nr:TolC family protein [Cytophagaceae bacterium]
MKSPLLSITFLLAGLLNLPVQAQTGPLEAYVQDGLQNNLTIRQQQFNLQKALLSLDEAKSLFLPSVNLGASYTTSAGGRRIAIPVGDLLNPVYRTLNQLAQTDRFPTIENVSEQFFPKNFYDARFRVTQPLVNAEIYYNRRIRQEQITLQRAELNVFKRELVKDIKTAYFTYLKAAEAIRVYQNTRTLLLESQRVNQALVNNQMANPTVLIRSKNELGKMDAEITQAENNRRNAGAYFNFLLNKDLDTPIGVDSTFRKLQLDEIPTGTREELDKLKSAVRVNQTVLKLNQSFRIPRLGAQLDLGSQATNWNFNDDTRYALLGISLDIPIYAGNRNNLKIRQTQTDLLQLQTQTEQVEDQLRLQAFTTENSLLSARDVYGSRRLQTETAQRYYRDLFRRYKENQATFIELLDAQTQITTAQEQEIIALYDVWIRQAELERVRAGYVFN